MPITRAALRRLRLPLPRSSCGGIWARQLHATARRPNAPWPTKYDTDLRTAQKLYYDFFPCTLHYYSWRGPKMAMHGCRLPPGPDDLTPPLSAVEQDNLLGADAVRVQDDGLVYPGPVGTDPVWSGAMLMPQATFLLEITGNYHDFYEEQKAAGRDVPEPYFFTVPKGERCPTLLLRADLAKFHLVIQDCESPIPFFWPTSMRKCSTSCLAQECRFQVRDPPWLCAPVSMRYWKRA